MGVIWTPIGGQMQKRRGDLVGMVAECYWVVRRRTRAGYSLVDRGNAGRLGANRIAADLCLADHQEDRVSVHPVAFDPATTATWPATRPDNRPPTPKRKVAPLRSDVCGRCHRDLGPTVCRHCWPDE